MPYISSPQDLREAFVQLPDNVRKWLASEKVLAVVSDMNERLEYFGDKVSVIPWLITRLSVKDLAPKYFMSELRDYLVVDENEARAITEEIDKRILRPIEPALNRLDIDLNSLYLGQAQPAGFGTSGDGGRVTEGGTATPMIGAREQFGITAERRDVSGDGGRVTEAGAKGEGTPDAGRRTPDTKLPEGPVILHTEKEEISQIAHGKPGETPSVAWPSFSISIPQSKYKKPTAPPPVTVRIETPEPVRGPMTDVGSAKHPSSDAGHPTRIEPPKIMKVVHYSDFRTPLT